MRKIAIGLFFVGLFADTALGATCEDRAQAEEQRQAGSLLWTGLSSVQENRDLYRPLYWQGFPSSYQVS
jgi:hypothetical protein